MHQLLLSAALLAPVLTVTATRGAQESATDTPRWIWLDTAEADQEAVLRRTFELDAVPETARLAATCDNQMIVTLNGERLGVHGDWARVATRDAAEALVVGTNVLEVRGRNDGGPAGLALRLDLGGGRAIVTDASWQVALPQRARRGRWDAATVLGPVGDPELPWSAQVTAAAFDAAGVMLTAAAAGEPQAPRPADQIHLPEGFVAELLYTVPHETQGSWVSLGVGPDGCIFASDQGGKGIFKVTPAAIGEPDAVTRVEPVDTDVSGAQGLVWAFDSLYANVNGQGLWRIRDTDGDGALDDAEHLVKLNNGGEHGPHAVLPTADGTQLYFIGGNHTTPPPYEGSRAPSNWGEDLLLPRLWDARGHARGKVAPGGWIARCDPDGTDIEIVSSGYRNQYDIALSPEGEMFTYDADMEWDQGTPWYRPTRICHVTSGSEFGWRSGTGKWPAHYEDSLPPVLDIGPGSPTGVLFGTGAAFPARYQRALYALDWTFGTIYALHLEPDGASYRATKEEFAWAKPLAVTDAVIGEDGAMVFAVGGRGSQSALYRIRYAGQESTAPARAPSHDAGAEARATRRALERFHGRVAPGAVEAAWPHLASQDRFVRFAARIALENQPVGTWRARALDERDPRAATTALVALARQGGPADLEPLMGALLRLDPGALEGHERLTALRACALALVRLGEPSEGLRARLLAALEPLFPVGTHDVDLELARLLTHLGSGVVVERAMPLMTDATPVPLPAWAALIQRNDTYGGPIARMLADMPPTRGISYALVLRNATEGWTPELRRRYFEFFVDASAHPGGASYAGFLEDIRADAVDTLTAPEERALASLLGVSLIAPLPDDVKPPKGPGRPWEQADALALVEERLVGGRSHAAGQNLFHAASCSACHRFDGVGGAIGPDLSTAGNKFSVSDLLEAILEPSAAISDQYASKVVLDTDGGVTEGIVAEDGDEIVIYESDPTLDPIVLGRDEVQAIRESKVSQMPAGLVDGLNPDELADLVAYLISGGDPDAAVFKGVGGR